MTTVRNRPLIFGTIASFLTLIILTIQYPLQTTFPIGGDHTRYAAEAEQVLAHPSTLIKNSYYPATIALLALGHLLPGEWPTQLTVWVVLAHISAGLGLAALSFKINRWSGAAVALFFWGLTVTGPTHHIEDATLAQLLSLTPLLLSFLAWANKKYTYALLLLATTFTFHPFSGFIGTAVLGASLPLSLAHSRLHFRNIQRWVLAGGVAAFMILILSVTRFNFLDTNIPAQSSDISLIDLVKSRFGPFILTAPLGLFLLIRRYQTEPFLTSLIAILAIVSTLLIFNDYLHVQLFANRFVSYFMIAIALLASLAIPEILRTSHLPRLIIIGLVISLFTALALNAWQSSAEVFDFYETPHKYARIHPDELAAITWMRDNLPLTSIIASTTENRHSEWIPLLTHRPWRGVATFADVPSQAPDATYIIVFLHREKQPLFQIGREVFRNEGAVIFHRQL